MKQISEALRVHLAQEVTTLATCWQLTRRDGVSFGFTSHDANIEFNGVIYEASATFQASAVASSIDLAADNYDLEGVLQSDAIREQDILAGLYDYAEISCFMVNYNAPEDGALQLKYGWLGEVTLNGQQFTAEVRGIADVLQRTVGDYFSATCRASLGDNRCKVNLAGYTVSGAVSSSDSLFVFTDTQRSEAAGYYDYGIVEFTSGANVGVKREIKQYAGGEFRCFQSWPYAIEVGDNYTAIAGCNKTLNTCVSRFNNAINFRGEPFVPSSDAILETSSTRSR